MFKYTTSRFKNKFWDQRKKKGGGGGFLLLSNEIMSTEKSGVQSSFAKTVRQIVVKEWPISRY